MRPARSFSILTALLLTLMLLAAPSASVVAAPSTQTDSPDARIQALMEQMTPEEKVGQLFLVTFPGSDVSLSSNIYDLIVNHHIGGIVLMTRNDNLAAAADGVQSVWELNKALQEAEYQASLGAAITEGGSSPALATFVPLFIGLEQHGGGYPNDQILSGLTPLPSPLAIGATWRPDLARQVGEVLGRELSALGFNLLLGPSLDVSGAPAPESPDNLGVRTFGGNPYWVGQIAGAYILGLHDGSQGRMAAIAQHLPGQGGLDQPPDQEIPTVRKSLAELKQRELLPFFTVTGNAADEQAVADGMLLTHIRYEGFQGSIRPSTRPVSLDPQALGSLLSLPEFAAWRQEGGLVISDQLGTRALRRFFDPSESEFTRQLARDIALEAFLAGNDVLFVANFTANGDIDSYPSILATLSFFAQKYRDDVAFAQRVDQSVSRILKKKIEMYGTFEIDNILPPETALEQISGQNSISFEVSRQAVTLLSPQLADLDAALPAVPDQRTRIVIFTDSYSTTQCSQCPPQQVLPVDALGQAIIRFYGPLSGGRVLPERVLSYPASDISQLLGENGQSSPLAELVEGAQWIVFAMQDVTPERPASQLFRTFLAERTDLIQDRNLIVFAFEAPYYLNATETSKLTAYYGLYSNGQEFVNVAARLLFKELATPGAPPVSVNGIGYSLASVITPDPQQTIPLLFEYEGDVYALENGENGEIGALDLQVGDLINLWAGVVLDHNGNPVPDGTDIHFEIASTQEGVLQSREIIVKTTSGVAQTTVRIETPGTLQLRAFGGDPPASTDSLRLEISGVGLDITTPAPPAATAGTSDPLTPASPTQTTPADSSPRSQTNLGDWSLAIIVSAFTGLFAYQAGAMRGYVRWGVRWGLIALIGGLLVAVYLGFGLPGSAALIARGGLWAVVLAAFAGALFGWLVAWLWWLLSRRRVD